MEYANSAVWISSALLAALVGSGLLGCSNDYAPRLNQDADTSFGSDATDTELEELYRPDTVEDAGDTDSSTEPVWTSGCDCTEPEEKCTIRNFCGLPDAECGPDVGFACPDGYTCQRQFATSDVFVCICTGEGKNCTPACESNDDCPENLQVCSFEDGVCRWNVAGGCGATIQCPEGYYCTSDGLCEPTGEQDVGEMCEDDGDCHTGICHENFCDEQCLSDDDCPEGKGCRRSGGQWRGIGCVSIDCEITCPANTRCFDDECRPAGCVTTKDCDSGDCAVIPHPQIPDAVGECVESQIEGVERHCKPEETFSYAGYCQLTDPCWDDSHCDEPYECESGIFRRPIDSEAQP